MKRRTLDTMFSVGGLVLAGLLLVMGLVLNSNANFAKNYVKDQLIQQRIRFKPAASLTAEEKAQACVVKYAGQAITTGKQAECYANHFIGLHLTSVGGGKTYAELGDVQAALRAQITDAQKTNAPNLADLQKQLADVTTQRETVFKGETLRGLLLTSYGFSIFGVKGSQVATVAFALGGLMLLLAIAGLIHALRTPATTGFAIPTPAEANGTRKVPVNV
jgi:hypothetical protein